MMKVRLNIYRPVNFILILLVLSADKVSGLWWCHCSCKMNIPSCLKCRFIPCVIGYDFRLYKLPKKLLLKFPRFLHIHLISLRWNFIRIINETKINYYRCFWIIFFESSAVNAHLFDGYKFKVCKILLEKIEKMILLTSDCALKVFQIIQFPGWNGMFPWRRMYSE